MRKLTLPMLLVFSFLLSVAPLSANLLTNPGFETPFDSVTPPTPVSYTGLCGGGNSAAANWSIFVNSCKSDISTQLLPSTLPGGEKLMAHVTTNGSANGLVQVFDAFNGGPPTVIGSAWVFLNSGCIGIGTGNGGNTGIDATTCLLGQWINLKAPNGVSPANEFIVYSTALTGANYFVDNASVTATAVPEPGTLGLLATGLLECIRRSRKLRKRR